MQHATRAPIWPCTRDVVVTYILDTYLFFIFWALVDWKSSNCKQHHDLKALVWIGEAEAGTKTSRCIQITCFRPSLSVYQLFFSSAKHKTFFIFQNVGVSSRDLMPKLNMRIKKGGWKWTMCLFTWIYSFCVRFFRFNFVSFHLLILSTPSFLSLSPDKASWAFCCIILTLALFLKGAKSQIYYPCTGNWFWSFALKT